MILLMAFATFTINMFAVRTVIKHGGGIFGYDSVEYQSGGGNSTLICENPGLTRCRPSTNRGNSSNEHRLDALVNVAEAHIKNGQLTGDITNNNGNVKWNATDEYNATIIAK